MAAIDIISLIIENGIRIKEAVDEVKSFKSQSKTLAKRIEALVEPVEKLSKDVKAGNIKLPSDDEARETAKMRTQDNFQRTEGGEYTFSYIRPLKELKTCTEQVAKFLEELSSKNFLQKFLKKDKISSRFNSFNSQLTILQQSLSFSLQIVYNMEMKECFGKMFNQDSMLRGDIEAIAQDIEEIKQRPEANEELSSIMRDMMNQIEDLKAKLALYNEELRIGYNEFSTPELIEEGTFGPIYKTRHNEEEKLLVIKKYVDTSSKRVLMEQLIIWKKFAKSRFVIQPYGYTTDEEGRMCFVLEYMHLGTLRKVLLDQSQDLPWDVRLSLALDCAQGLYAIHYGNPGKTMLHRAVTSTRFLVNKHYEAKIADNGFVTSSSKVSRSQRKEGDVEQDEINYQVPEDAGHNFKATMKSEVYRLGVIFYEIASRMKPFQSLEKDGKKPTIGEKLEYIQGDKMEELPADTPDDFKHLIERCRARKPSDRPSTSKVVTLLRDAKIDATN